MQCWPSDKATVEAPGEEVQVVALGADDMRRAGPVSRAGSVCRDLGTSVKHIKNQLCDYMEKSQPGQLGSRLAGLKIYHVIAIAGPARLAGTTLSRH